MKSIRAISRSEAEDFCGEHGYPSFRAKQLLDWIYAKMIFDPALMLNLPLAMRESLSNEFDRGGMTLKAETLASDETRKLLLELRDGERIEAVIIPSPGRKTFCLSTQVGCPVGCRFCASGSGGLVRNLDSGEILEQFNYCCGCIGGLPDNVVFMGIGEGLLNFDNLKEALQFMTGEEYFGLGARRVTVSTSGWVPGIRKLADLERQWNLAVSLHAADDATRALLIPEAMRYPLAEILSACDYYRTKTTRMVTFEYTLLAGINDSRAQAEALAALAREHHAKVNLIPYNQTGMGFRRPERAAVEEFRRILESRGARVTVRVEKGGGSSAACGQLRRGHE